MRFQYLLVTRFALLASILFATAVHAQSAPTAPTAPSAPTAPKPPTATTGDAIPAPAPAPPPPVTFKDGVVQVGSVFKKTLGRVTDIDKGDNGCYLTLVDDKKDEFIEIGVMELCKQKPSFKGKKVELSYRIETITASSCYGDPKCKKTETIPIVVKVVELN